MLVVLNIILLILCFTAIGMSIYAIYYSHKSHSEMETWVFDIKKRMSKLITDINAINELEYNLDVAQDVRLNKIQGVTVETTARG